ncbi:MAG: Rieske 2Fe-2S domain-containing protein [Rhizobiales bacterium]|nr:Rieske 2Fe-2S domain-containing protein [Hyphomicrobiales bacterium]
MSQDQAAQTGPDLTQGVKLSDFENGKLSGHVGDQEVLLVQSGADIFAVGAHCSHYHAPLADGLVVGDTVRCPWHHACFSLRSGEAVRAPAFDTLTAWQVERDGDRIVVRKQIAPASSKRETSKGEPGQIVIVGGGAAGFAAAEMLRRRKFGGRIVMLSQDTAPPVDRPNLSKDYLAGSAPEDWLPLRGDDYYREANIDLRRDVEVAERWAPTGRKMVAIQVGEAEGGDVSRADAGAVQTPFERARADAGVDEQDAGRRPEDRCVSGRAAGKDAEFKGHRRSYCIEMGERSP